MAVRWAVANGDWSNTATWNSGSVLGIPTGSDDVWANNFNVNINQSFSVTSLNSTARTRDIATPLMTSNTTPTPYAVSSPEGIFTTGNEVYRAFDRSLSSQWISANTRTSGSLVIDLGTPIIIDGYTMYGSNTNANSMRNWTLEGSNNALSWTVLQIVTSSLAASPAAYTVGSIGNVQSYRYYRINCSLNGGGASFGTFELELYELNSTPALAAGGSFIFNSGSISGSATSTTAALTAGATNLIQVTATTGSVGLTLGSNVTHPALGASTQTILHSGNCNFNLNGQNFTGGSSVTNQLINKTSAGTITITGNLIGGGGGNIPDALVSSNGNTVVIGNVTAGVSGRGISQTAGNVTVTGNVIGGSVVGINLTGAASQFTVIGNVTGGTATSAFGINFTGTSGSVTGTVTGGTGTGATGITTSGVVSVTGNVNGGSGGAGIGPTANTTVIGNVTGGTAGAAISTASNITMTVTGTATAGTVQAINSTSTGTVNLTGNMINVSGRQAIHSQNLFISDAATTQWRLFTQGGQDKTLYSADTFPNQPTAANVRSGSLFGPANALSGSMVVPVPSDVRVNVLTDNTVGTGQSLTAADFLAAISASADPYAQRLRNIATVDTVGSLITGLNGGGF